MKRGESAQGENEGTDLENSQERQLIGVKQIGEQ